MGSDQQLDEGDRKGGSPDRRVEKRQPRSSPSSSRAGVNVERYIGQRKRGVQGVELLLEPSGLRLEACDALSAPLDFTGEHGALVEKPTQGRRGALGGCRGC